MKEYSSIFNHALAPITPGPSSSNTCGPVRIGLVCHQLLGGIPKKAVVEYYSKGAFVTTLYGMRSDLGFINGLLGKEQNDPEFSQAYENANAVGMEILFQEVDDLTIGGMETARLCLTGQNGDTMTVVGESLGGGAFRLHAIEGCPVDLRGANHELIISLSDLSGSEANKLAEELVPKVDSLNDHMVSVGSNGSILILRSAKAFASALLDQLNSRAEILWAREISPIHPIVTDISRTPPFESAVGLMAYCEENHCSIAQAAIDYEMTISGWTEEEIRTYSDMLWDIMRASLEGGFRPDLQFNGIVTPKAAQMKGKIGAGAMPSLGLLDDAIPSALGIMEHSNAAGKIVCVPTGGSSGILPALLLSAAERMASSNDDLHHALMAAGIIGVMMMVDGNEFAGGTHGCQAEIACGAAMSAAGLVQLMGGTPKQACDAASMCLQSFLGLICDPVAGLVQVPCLARNIAGVSVAAASAQSVCAGFDVVIPLDEMSRIMVQVGGRISKELGMCCNGCCLTPTGTRLAQEQSQ